jgi:tRNA (cytidine/uridine-2'-O-)-methyltransferase
VLHVALFQPEIPPNTGNVIRLCANSGAALHLIRPLGFALDHSRLRRAGLDYHEFARVLVHDDFEAFLAAAAPPRWFALSRRGRTRHDTVRYADGDAFVFGRETSGLPEEVLARVPPERRLCLPMRPGSRSLNLSNAVAVTVYEAWRQLGFAGAAAPER